MMRETVEGAVMNIRASYPVTVDYDRPMKEALLKNGYLNFASDIILRQIITEERGRRTIGVDLFCNRTTSTTMGMLWSMHMHLRRPIDAIELLSFGEQHPDIPSIMPVIALGTPIVLGRSRFALGLMRDEDGRRLHLYPLDAERSVDFTFAGTRK